MTASPKSDARQLSRTVLRQKLESLYRSGVQQLTRPPLSAIPLVQEVAIVAEPPREPSPAPAPPSRPPAPPVRPAAAEITRSHPAPVAAAPTPAPAAPATSAISASPLPLDQRVAALAALRNEVVLCRRCDELAQKRTQTVFGVGHPRPRLCFLGEARERTKIAKANPSWVQPASCWTRSSPPAH